MKPKHLLLLMAFAIIAAISCQKQEVSQAPESVAIVTQPDPKGETVQAGTRAVTIAATADWSAISDADWITVNPSSGPKGMHEVVLTFTENTTGAKRTGSVTFTSGTYSETYTLTQN